MVATCVGDSAWEGCSWIVRCSDVDVLKYAVCKRIAARLSFSIGISVTLKIALAFFNRMRKCETFQSTHNIAMKTTRVLLARSVWKGITVPSFL